jgi:transcriptional regulator with XRE-family HTH domain
MLSLVERGLRNPTLELLLKIADGIEIDLAAVLKKAQKSPSKSKMK